MFLLFTLEVELDSRIKVMISNWQAKFPLVILFTVLCNFTEAWARPEYALRIGNNRCTNCHYTPAGGGPRNLNGKYYGANGFKVSPFSAQPYAGADIKYLYYSPDKQSEVNGGLAAMAANIWAAIPVSESDSGATETRVVGEHNLGGFTSSGPRNLYVQFHTKDQTKTSWLPQDFMFGRFIPAYGLMTDEHRAYVRMQTASTWNMGIRMGAMASANPFEWLHYDLALLNGQENQGQSLAKDQNTQWGGIANLRLLNSRFGAMLGFSGAFYEASPGETSRSSQSVYTGVSLHRLTGERIKVSILAEYAEAVNWNTAGFLGQFVFDAAYATALAGAESRGMMAQVNWDLSRLFVLNYKYDRVELDRNFPSDVYERHGFGFKHFFGPNMWVMMRYENASSSRPGEEAGNKVGGTDAFWSVISVGI